MKLCSQPNTIVKLLIGLTCILSSVIGLFNIVHGLVAEILPHVSNFEFEEQFEDNNHQNYGKFIQISLLFIQN